MACVTKSCSSDFSHISNVCCWLFLMYHETAERSFAPAICTPAMNPLLKSLDAFLMPSKYKIGISWACSACLYEHDWTSTAHFSMQFPCVEAPACVVFLHTFIQVFLWSSVCVWYQKKMKQMCSPVKLFTDDFKTLPNRQAATKRHGVSYSDAVWQNKAAGELSSSSWQSDLDLDDTVVKIEQCVFVWVMTHWGKCWWSHSLKQLWCVGGLYRK